MRYDAKPTPEHYFTSGEPGDVDWYILHTRTNHELLVQDTLERKGFGVYLPMETRTIRHARRQQVVLRPLFPRYLFVALSAKAPPFSLVLKTHGAQWWVRNRETPVRIRSNIVDELRKAEDDGLFDRTRKMPKPEIPFKPGDKVKLKDGSFANLPAIIVSAPSEKRIEVLITLLGRSTRLFTALGNLERVG